jgi:hypothetical protein
MKKFFIPAFPFLIAALLCGHSAEADLVIDPVFQSSITNDPNAATIEATIDSAISNLELAIANPVTVTIDFGEMSSGLGQSSTYQYDISYSDYLSLLENNQTLSAYDTKALNSLGLAAPYTSLNPTTNPVNGSTTIQTTGALLRALGVDAEAPTGQPDSTIDFNASLVDEATGTPTSGEYSLESVVTHEMDEALGIGGGGSQLNAVYEGYTSPAGAAGPLDLFRYSGVGVRSYTTAAGADPYFSIDGGITKLDYFNQDGSTGSDYGDWGNGITNAQYGNTPSQVQDAYGTPDTSPNLGAAELTALDVIGWNLNPQGAKLEAVPEPNCAWLLVGGLAVAAGIKRRYAWGGDWGFLK